MFIIFYYDFFSDPLKRHFWILLTNTKRKHKNNNKKIVLFVSQSAPWLKVSFEVNRRKRKEAKDWIHIWTVAFWVCHGAPQPFRSDYLFCPHFPTLHVFFQEELPMEKALVHTSCKNLFIMINSNAKQWLKNYHTIESVLSGGTQNKETYWVCLSKGQAALKREEKRRGGERKERERREGRGVFSWTDL